MSERFVAARADIEWRANTGAVEADVEKLRREFRTSTQAMSDDTLKLAVAQDRLDKALLRHGPSSTQAKNAELALRREMDATANSSRRLDRNIDENTRSFGRFGRGAVAGSGALRGLGRSLAFASTAFLGGAGLVYALRSTVEASLAFESAFAGVRKTVDATEQEFSQLSEGIREMSREIPIAATELAKITELGGQLGISNDNLLKFTRTVADLGQTTDLATEQAATSFAQLANITRLPQGQIDRLGATTVALGNNFATTESKIVDFALRIAGAAKIIGFTEAQTLATGAAFSSLGVEAEAGGTAVSKVFISLANAVKSGGKDLEAFASTAGLTGAEFQKLFRRDAAGAFLAFVEGLQRVDKEGGNVFKTLSDLGLTDQRLIRAFLGISQADDLLRRSFALSSDAWRENIALTVEAGKRYATSESQLRIFQNRVTDLKKAVGDALVPALLDVIEPLGAWLDKTENQQRVQRTVNELVEDGAEVVRGLASGLRLVKEAAEPVIDALGGLANTVELVLIAGFVKKSGLAAFAIGAIRAASARTTAGIVSDNLLISRSYDGVALAAGRAATATTLVGRIGQYGAPIPGRGGAGRRGIPPVLLGNPALITAGGVLISGGGGTQRGDRSKKYPRVYAAVQRASDGQATPEELAIIQAELGRYSLANAPDANMARAERRLLGLVRSQRPGAGDPRVGDRPSERPGVRATPRDQVGAGTGGGGGGGGDGDGQPRRTLEDIRLDQARDESRGGSGERFLREERDVLQRQIRVLERRKNLSDEQKEKLRGLYGDIARVQSEIDGIHRDAQQRAEERRRKSEEERKQREDRIRERIDTREQTLVSSREAAELTERLSDDVKRQRNLIAFYRAQERNDELTAKERRAYHAKRIKAEQDLASLEKQRGDRGRDLKEQRLENAREAAELTETLDDDKRRQQQLVAFFRQQARDRDNTAKERADYRKKEIAARKTLQALKGEDGTGLTEAEVRRKHIEFLGRLQGIRNDFGGNIEMSNSAAGGSNIELTDSAGWARHSQNQQLLKISREQRDAMRRLADGVQHPNTRYAAVELEARFDGVGAF